MLLTYNFVIRVIFAICCIATLAAFMYMLNSMPTVE